MCGSVSFMDFFWRLSLRPFFFCLHSCAHTDFLRLAGYCVQHSLALSNPERLGSARFCSLPSPHGLPCPALSVALSVSWVLQ